MQRGPDVRLRALGTLAVAVLILIVGRLVWLQVLEHDRYRAVVRQWVERPYALQEPPWGVILDRNGDLLVGNVPVFDVEAYINNNIQISHTHIISLATILNLPIDTITRSLEITQDIGVDVQLRRDLARHIPIQAADAISDLNQSWLVLIPRWERYYAEGALASHTLGFVNEDREGYGVQAAMVRLLRGEQPEKRGELEALGSPLPTTLMEGVVLPRAGVDLRLTIDRTLQAYVEGELDKAIVETGASGGTILVIDPRTGEILAVASRPHYEPRRFAEYWAQGRKDLFLDPAASLPYEPGSVMKVVTVAAALDAGVIGPDWAYNDTGYLEYGGIVIQNWNRQGFGWQDLQGVLDNSLNTGAATITTRFLKATTFYKYLLDFGFGKVTGVEVTGEAPGKVNLPTDLDWYDSHLATNSFGQGLTVTPLQMAAAIATIANEGRAMQLHVIAERRYPDGTVVVVPPKELNRPISAETARLVSEMMVRVVDGKLTMAAVPGYRIAGKSGTAQIPTAGGYDPVNVITSFIGFGPVPDPRLLILVKIDRPQNETYLRWGTRVAAPVFQRVMARSLVLLGIPPSDVRAGP